jgi:selenocysteine-specific elongation factor
MSSSPATDQPLAHVVVGTAGHIDHGKSALVLRLTGQDPDRLPQERERGITIDLGFAARQLADGRQLGFVDVPGHERFIRNMVAGATGMDLCILVVAADDGVMPQTREHLAILELLGVEHLLVALTKCDLVDEEELELALDDVRELLAGTRYAGADLRPCSAVTGEGVEELWQAIEGLVPRVPARATGGIFRLPVQRVFSARGFGTVVTGVPVAGEVGLGDQLEVLPGGLRGKVRGIQAHGEARQHAVAGHRTALNLADVDFKAVQRGMVVATPGVLKPSRHVALRVHMLREAPGPVEDGDRVRLHVGTAEVIGEVAILEGQPLEPGASALVQLVVQEPVVTVPGDRCILRRHSPMLTLGGGIVLRLDERRLKRRRAWILEDLTRREAAVGDPEAWAEYMLDAADAGILQGVELARELGIPPAAATARLRAAVERGEVHELAADRFTTVAHLEEARAQVREHLVRFHDEHPERHHEELSVLRAALPWDERLIEQALADLAAAGDVVVEGNACRLAAPPPPPRELAAAREQVAELYRERTFEAPRQAALAGELGLPDTRAGELLTYLVDAGDLVRVAEDLYLHRETVDRTLQTLQQVIAASGEVDTNEFKKLLGISRKFLIPLLEFFDAIGVTVRDGNKRYLRKARR